MRGVREHLSVTAIPEAWWPFMREAELVRYSLANGLHSLSRANYADKGVFTHAFFNLATGYERLMKLVYLIDHALLHDGAFPTNQVMQNQFGHDLVSLYRAATTIRTRLVEGGEDFEWHLPDEMLAGRIVGVLGEFARATRYHNLDFLVGRQNLGRDPLQAWTDDIARYLMSDYPARLRRRDEAWAGEAAVLLEGRMILRHTAEDRQTIDSVPAAVLHGRRGEWVQKQATFHCAAIVRELAEVLGALTWRARRSTILSLPGLDEYFAMFDNDDRYLKGRRTFLD